MSLENVCPFCAKTWDNFHQCAPTKTPLSLDEFDEKSAADESENNCYGRSGAFVKGARWQHSKDKAVIQELREHIGELHKLRKNERTEIQALKAEIERLKNPKLKIGQYEIRVFHNGNYWIEHESGEAMETAKDKLEACITQFYADNF